MGIKRNRTQKFQEGGKTFDSNKRKWINAVASELGRHGIPDDKIKYVLAQAIQESGWDRDIDNLVNKRGNNVFNIIKGESWVGDTHTRGDSNAKGEKISQEFRSYDSIADSVKDYLNTLQRSFPDAYSNLTSEDGTIDGFLSGLKDGVYGSYAEAMKTQNKDGSIEDTYSPKIKSIAQDSLKDATFTPVNTDKEFTDDNAVNSYYSPESRIIDFSKPKLTDILSPEDREKAFNEAKENLIEKDGKYYNTKEFTRKVDSKRKNEAEFKNATGKFNLNRAITRARQEGNDDLVDNLLEIREKMGDTSVSMSRNDAGGVDWQWEGEDKIGTNLLGKRKQGYAEAMEYVMDNDFINYDQVEEKYEDADLGNEWKDDKDYTTEQYNEALAENQKLQNEYDQKVAEANKQEELIAKEREEWLEQRRVEKEDDKTDVEDAAEVQGEEVQKLMVRGLPGEGKGKVYEHNDSLVYRDPKSGELYIGSSSDGKSYDTWSTPNNGKDKGYLREFEGMLNTFNDSGKSMADDFAREYEVNDASKNPNSVADMVNWYRTKPLDGAEEYYRNEDGDYIAKNSDGFYTSWNHDKGEWMDKPIQGKNPIHGYSKFDYDEMVKSQESLKIKPEVFNFFGRQKNINFKKHGYGNNYITAYVAPDQFAKRRYGNNEKPKVYKLSGDTWQELEGKKWMKYHSNDGEMLDIKPDWKGEYTKVNWDGVYAEPEIPDEPIIYRNEKNDLDPYGGVNVNYSPVMKNGGTVEKEKIQKAFSGAALATDAAKFIRGTLKNDVIKSLKPFEANSKDVYITDHMVSRAGEDIGNTVEDEKFDANSVLNRKKNLQDEALIADYEQHMKNKPPGVTADKWSSKFTTDREQYTGENKIEGFAKKLAGGIDLGALSKFAFSKPVRGNVVQREVARPGQINTIAPNTGITTEQQRISEQQMANQMGSGTTADPNNIKGVVAQSKAISDYKAKMEAQKGQRKLQTQQAYNSQLNAVNQQEGRYAQAVLDNKFQNEAAQEQADMQYELLDQQRKGQLVADTLGGVARQKAAENQIDSQLMMRKAQTELAPFQQEYIRLANNLGTDHPNTIAALNKFKQKQDDIFQGNVELRKAYAKAYASPTSVGALMYSSGGDIMKEIIKEEGKTERAEIKAEKDARKLAQKAAKEAQKLFLKKEKEVKQDNQEMMKNYFSR